MASTSGVRMKTPNGLFSSATRQGPAPAWVQVHLAAPSCQNNVICVTARASKAETLPKRNRGGQVVARNYRESTYSRDLGHPAAPPWDGRISHWTPLQKLRPPIIFYFQDNSMRSELPAERRLSWDSIWLKAVEHISSTCFVFQTLSTFHPLAACCDRPTESKPYSEESRGHPRAQ